MKSTYDRIRIAMILFSCIALCMAIIFSGGFAEKKADAEMIVETTDGNTYTVPVDMGQVRAIRFTDTPGSETGAAPESQRSLEISGEISGDISGNKSGEASGEITESDLSSADVQTSAPAAAATAAGSLPPKSLESPPAEPSAPPARFPFLGRIWRVKEFDGKDFWNAIWTRRGDSDLFDGLWHNQMTGEQQKDVVEFKFLNNNQIILYRHNMLGNYTGTMADGDARVINGTASWYGPNMRWYAEIE